MSKVRAVLGIFALIAGVYLSLRLRRGIRRKYAATGAGE